MGEGITITIDSVLAMDSRYIPVHYGIEDFEQDIENLRQRGRL